ncbi:pyridoxamine 5'-phosphate oxidase-domain-containing protein [Boletus coccyginus]|nr:pyridoxamine 5'-phosphate oxidase-domain-containing protein [Boletus coccyginus]
MKRKGWYEALANALQKEYKGESPVMSLATIQGPSTPRVRTHLQRAFITASAHPTLPLILSTTDVRSPKVTHLAANATTEVVYWTPSTLEQFRVLGRASVVPEVGYPGTYPSPRGVVYEALEKEGFDWEAKRVETFDQMSAHMKATWCRPAPGTPLTRGEEETKGWPEKLPKLGEATDEREKKNLAVALSNFALLVIEPFEVDYIEFRVQPERRTLFERDWEDERAVEFKETLVVP